MKQADVIVAPLLQADGSIKNRPAIVLREMPVFRDLLVCGISTQLHHVIKDFDEIITASDADFADSGLVADSLIRLSFLAVLPRHKIAGSIGEISAEQHRRLLQNLSDYLTK